MKKRGEFCKYVNGYWHCEWTCDDYYLWGFEILVGSDFKSSDSKENLGHIK